MNEKIFLGISLGFNSSACILSNIRGLLAAISEERLNGEKNTKKIPIKAIKRCLEISNIKNLDQIAISHYETITNDFFNKYSYNENSDIIDWKEFLINYVINDCNVSLLNKEINIVDHHTAHALSTFGFYEFDNKSHYTITSDGFGIGLSGTIKYNNEIINSVPLRNSIALVYQFVTGALGFKMHQHEGKITGLAAFGKPNYIDRFESFFDIVDYGNGLEFKRNLIELDEDEKEQVKNSVIIDFDDFLKLKKCIFKLVDDLKSEGVSREDIAASLQEFSEKYTIEWVKRYCTNKDVPAYIAGGLFANVKINQRIKDLGIFTEVNVCPGMGDEGTCVGAAISLSLPLTKPVLPQSCGTKITYTYDDINNYLEKHNVINSYKVTEFDNSIEEIANRLSNNKIVCLVRENMEFGPRALCHRSILYNCDTKETNDWLNKKLSRTEFMPFAPVCRKEVADDLFINLDGGRKSAKFMTMTFDCTQEFINNYPAACHIDNTARPQIIHKEDDEYMWNILAKYEEKTGKKALINTSFNLHNWPIIENAEVAIDSWIKSDTDCLVINNVFIEKI